MAEAEIASLQKKRPIYRGRDVVCFYFTTSRPKPVKVRLRSEDLDRRDNV